MTAINKDLPKAAFDKIEFPFTSRSARLSARTHVHEYPKMAGGSVEKLGRKLWEFTFEVPFHATFERFPDLYPGRLAALTERCARLDTATLLVPEIGEIRCVLTSIDRKRQGRILSGEEATLTFLEDDLEPFRRTTAPASQAGLSISRLAVSTGMTFLVPGSLDEATLTQVETNTGSLLDLVDTIGALRDQTTLFGLQAQGKLSDIMRLSRYTHELIQGPVDLEPLRQALRDLWLAAHRLQSDLGSADDANLIRTYVVPTTLSVGQIAARLYADASRGGEILSLNRITDPFAVPAGTRLLTYTR